MGALVAEAIAITEKHFPGQGIRIGAQAGVEKCYESLGFQAAEDVYDKGGIAHIDVLQPAVSVAGFAVRLSAQVKVHPLTRSAATLTP